MPSPTPAPSAAAKVVGPLDLEACDLSGYVPCEQQTAALAVPVAGTGMALTYSSEWAPGRLDRPVWDAASLGLGGWSIDVVQRYDAANGVLLGGDGSWRLVAPVDVGSGETAIASYDGQLVYIFDASGRHVRTVDGTTGITLLTIAYDDAGLLLSIDGTRDGEPASLRVRRDENGLPQALAAADGAATTVGVDNAGDLNAVIDPTGAVVRTTWASGGLVTSVTWPTGGLSQYEYDSAGRLSATKDPDGVRVQWQRTAADGSVEISVASAGGISSTYRSEQVAGSLRRTYIAPDGTTTVEDEDAGGHRAVVLPDGTKINLGAQPDPRWGMQAPILTPFVQTRPDGVEYRAETTRTADVPSGGSLFEAQTSASYTADGSTWLETYDPTTRTLTATDPEQRVSSATFDDADRVVAAVAPGQPDVAYAYDDSGRLASETVGSGADAATSTYTYDGSTGTATITLPDGSVQATAVDGDGRPVQLTGADGATTAVLYDAAGRAVQARPPGHPSFTVGTSPGGRPTAWLPPTVSDDGSYELDSYTADGQLASVTGPGSRSLAFEYDTAARLVGMRSGRGQVVDSYDPSTGLLATSTAPGNVATSYGYSAGVLTTISWSGPVQGRVDAPIDAAGRVTSISVNGADPWALAYDTAGGLTALGDLTISRDPSSGLPMDTTVGVVTTHDEYDDQGRLVRAVTTVAGEQVLEQDYTYDSLSRIAGVTVTNGTSSAANTTAITYADGRLAGVSLDGVVQEQDSYDPAGNRVTVVSPAATVAATYDDRDRLLTWGDVTYQYAPDGTLLQQTGPAGVTAFQYDDTGSLLSSTVPDGRQVQYTVDAEGRRVGRSVDGVLTSGYVYGPDGQLAAQLDGSGAVVARFAWDDAGRLAYVIRDGHTYRAITDQVGSPILVVDAASGQVVEKMQYDAWGRLLSDSGTAPFTIGFAGGLQDPDTGLVLFGARDYDPVVGRWTSSDPIRFQGGDANLYRYAGGDPVNQTDPSGLMLPTLPNFHLPSLPKLHLPSFPHIPSPSFKPPPTTPGVPKAPPPPAPAPPKTPPAGGPRTFGCHYAVLCNSDPDAHDYYCLGYKCEFGRGIVCQGLCSRVPGHFFCLGSCYNPTSPLVCHLCEYGDPHFQTADGVPFDFQAAGEFLIAASADGSVVLQARQEPLPVGSDVSITSAMAVGVAGDRVMVSIIAGTAVEAGSSSSASDVLTVSANGNPVTGADVSMRLPNGGILERHGALVTIDWPSGTHLFIERHAYNLNYGLTPDAAIAPTLRGLGGSEDGDPSNDLTGRDGVVLDPSDPDFFNKLYHQFGDSWRITQAESLFDYAPGQDTSTFTLPDFPIAPATIDMLDPDTRAQAEALCKAVGVTTEPGLTNCILDVGVTGDSSYAAGAAAFAASNGPAANAVQNGVLQGFVFGQIVTGEISDPAVRDRYTFAGTAGEVIYLAATNTTCVDGLYWRLLLPDGNTKTEAVACHDLGRVVLSTAGTYTVEVYSDGTATGAYGFRADEAPTPKVDTLTIGDTITGTLAQIGEWHDYTFSGTAGEVIYLAATNTTCVDDLYWRLLQPDGSTQTVAATCRDMGRVVLSTAGTYTVEVYSDRMATGPYSFETVAAPPPTVASLTIGNTITGTLAQIGEWHDHTFSGTAGQVVNLVTTETTCVDGLYWRLLQPDGSTQTVAATCRDLGVVTLPVDGTYTIEVYSDSTATGGYSFTTSAGSP